MNKDNRFNGTAVKRLIFDILQFIFLSVCLSKYLDPQRIDNQTVWGWCTSR